MPFSYVPSNILWSSVTLVAAIAIARPLLGVDEPDPRALRSFDFWDSLKSAEVWSFDILAKMALEGRIRVSAWYIF